MLDLNEHRGRNVKYLHTSLCTRHGTVSYIKRANAASVSKHAPPPPPYLFAATSRQKLKCIIPGSLFVVDSDAKFAARVTCARIDAMRNRSTVEKKTRGVEVHFNAIKLIDALCGCTVGGSEYRGSSVEGESLRKASDNGEIFGAARHFSPLIDARVP